MGIFPLFPAGNPSGCKGDFPFHPLFIPPLPPNSIFFVEKQNEDGRFRRQKAPIAKTSIVLQKYIQI